MRVLHFYKTYFPDSIGGIERAINQIARKSAAMGVTADVLSLTPDLVDRTIEIDGHLAHRAHRDFEIASTAFSLSVLWRFYQLARKADVIHYHYPWPFMDVVHFATRVRKPTVVTYHSDIIRQRSLLQLYRPLQRRFLGNIDRIVATSPNYLEASSTLARYADKVTVIPIGLEKSSYPIPPQEKIDHWSGRLPKKFFLFVGALRYYKGLHLLIEAARGADYPVFIVGAGPIETELKAQASRLGVHNVHFLGSLPDVDMVTLLNLCYAVVFPSHLRSEAFGISLLEGAMYGKPLISSEIGTGTSYINIHNLTGLVVPPSDPSQLRAAMSYLWDNEEMAAEMGRRAQQRYSDLFSADRTVASYVELYRQLKAETEPSPTRMALISPQQFPQDVPPSL